MPRLDLAEDRGRGTPRVEGVAHDGADLGHVPHPLNLESPRGGQDIRRALQPEEGTRHSDFVVGGRKVVHRQVVGIEPVRVLRVGKQPRVTGAVHRVACPAGAMGEKSPAHPLPCLEAHGALGHKAEGALVLVLINVDVKAGPVPVRRLEPRASLSDATDRPATRANDFSDEIGDRVLARRCVHGYSGCSSRFQFEAYCPTRER